MIRKVTPKLRSTALPSRAEVAAAIAALGLLTSAPAHAWQDPPAQPPEQPAAPGGVPAAPDPWPTTPPGTVADPEGMLIVKNMPEGVSVFLGEELLPSEEVARGIMLPPGALELRFHWACGQNTMYTVTIVEGGTTELDAAPILTPPGLETTGGVPVDDDRFTVHGGCCGGAEQAAIDDARARTSAAGLALLVALVGARRRRRR